MINNEYEKLLAEIEKLKFHNTSLLTLISSLHDEQMQQPTIHETVVLFDLSKSDLRGFTKLVQDYDGSNYKLEEEALKINPVFRKNNIISILKSFITSEMLVDKSTEILKSYE
ncbi:hypothetical protein [Jeotgalicoccus psychrophilus]|uniref:hypothetical protein n=1 Tax=Jeotgalicoccus psychrophilus TaxID=157228 RepID=UPI000419C7B2|nr:hypothetical protein [Jeotgalicoccus psychrophilus]